MANPTSGYGSYRGRGHPVFRLLLLLLVIVIALAGVSIFLLQPYIIYSADGVQINLPFLSKDPIVDEPIPAPQLVVETPEPTPTPTLNPLAQAQSIDRYLPVTITPESGLPSLTAGIGYLLSIKGEQGALPYVSAVEKAVSMKASGSDEGVNAAIEVLTGGDGHTVGVMSCFKDQAAGDGDYAFCILSNSGYRWTDDTEVRWISPTKAAVRQYVLDLALEAADFGFDEILLTYAHYPASGTFSYIKNGADYDQKQLGAVVDGFYQEVSSAFSEQDCLISVYACDEFLQNPEGFRSGQSAENMLANFDRIWYNEALASFALERVFGGDAALMAERGVAIDTATPEFAIYQS